MPDVSVIIVSHNKPFFVKQAVQSLLDQTHRNWNAVLMDSGVLYNQGFFDFIKDDRIKVVPTGETEELRRRVAMAPWCFNQALNGPDMPGELILYLCDDDLYVPKAFEVFWNFYQAHDRKPQMMYGCEIWEFWNRQNQVVVRGKRYADVMRGSYCQGFPIYTQVDYLQLCHTRKLLQMFQKRYGTSEYYAESHAHDHDADGVFLEQLGALTPVYPIDALVAVHRNTAISVNYPPNFVTNLRSWLYLRKLQAQHCVHRLQPRHKARMKEYLASGGSDPS